MTNNNDSNMTDRDFIALRIANLRSGRSHIVPIVESEPEPELVSNVRFVDGSDYEWNN